jgi:inorganic pyrophosphatase
MPPKAGPRGITDLEAYDPETGALRVVIETPRGSRSKIKFDEELGLYKLSHVLPAGMTFPFDFGFVPGTRGEDGDPLDVLVLFDGSTHMGCFLLARLVGVIEAEQTEGGATGRNDRLLAVALESREHRDIDSLASVGSRLLDEIEHFFVSYNELRGKHFEPVGRHGPERAERLVREATTPRRPRARAKRATAKSAARKRG